VQFEAASGHYQQHGQRDDIDDNRHGRQPDEAKAGQ